MKMTTPRGGCCRIELPILPETQPPLRGVFDTHAACVGPGVAGDEEAGDLEVVTLHLIPVLKCESLPDGLHCQRRLNASMSAWKPRGHRVVRRSA